MPFVPDKPGATASRFVPDAPPPTAPPAAKPDAPWEGDMAHGLLTQIKNLILGAPEVAASGVTMAGAGLKGIAEGGGAAVGELAARLRGDALPEENPIDTAVKSMQDSTLQPSTGAGKGAAQMLSAPLELAGRGTGAAARAVGVPEPIANEIEQQTPNVLGAAAALIGAKPSAAGATSLAERGTAAETVGAPATQLARKMGLKLRPSDVQAAAPGKAVPGTKLAEHLNEPAVLKSEFTLHNQQQITRLGGEDLGLKNVDRLDDTTFDKLKAPEVATYAKAEAAAQSVPLSPELQSTLSEATAAAKFRPGETPGITRTLGALRRRSAKNIKAADVATQDAGFADRDLADRLEAAFGKQLETAGSPELLAEYQAARQRFAKIHDAETATRAGQLDASVMTKLAKHGAPLTGRFKMIADVNEHFPHATKHSLTTAASTIEHVANRSRIIRNVGEAVARNIPGLRSKLNVHTEGFQNRFGGAATPTEESYFAKYGVKPEVSAPRDPSMLSEQLGLGVGQPLELSAPAGEVGAPPARAIPPEMTAQDEMLGRLLDLMPAEGEVGRIPPKDVHSQSEGFGPLLDLAPPKGYVGRPRKRK